MYKSVFILVCMLVVYGIFAFHNSFNSAKVTVIRRLIAVVAGWLLVILFSLLLSKMDITTVAAAVELAEIQEKANARRLGALLFGWAYPLIFLELIWLAVFTYRYCKKNNYINFNILKP